MDLGLNLESTQLLSPAKINLMLRVVGQRADGYHLLQTCFQLLDWGDEITFKPAKPTSLSAHNNIEIVGFHGLNSEDNLIHQAAQMLKPWAQVKSDWLVKVNKKIPQGSGLGGGSSNAAVALKFFNQAWQCGLGLDELMALAVKLGADVPVFVAAQSALATGIGDELTPMHFDTPYILLLFPDCHINTAELFESPDLNRTQSPVRLNKIQLPAFWINDFMPVVLKKKPLVNQIYQRLKRVMQLRLSGSGSTLFGLFKDLSAAQMAHQQAAEICDARLVQPQQCSDDIKNHKKL